MTPIFALPVLFAALAAAGARATPQALELRTNDGVRLNAAYYHKAGPARPLILLFHQAGSNLHEYDAIAPRLVSLGFDALAIDQRSGGNFYPPGNVTVARRGGVSDAKFTDALPDLEAALAFGVRAQTHGAHRAPIFAWGSSYSAALVFALGAEHPGDLDAILAFSPGEYFSDKHFVRKNARRIAVPVFLDSAADPQEEAATAGIAGDIPRKFVTRYVPQNGIHGSSTLNPARDPDGTAENWRALEAFLLALPRA